MRCRKNEIRKKKFSKTDYDPDVFLRQTDTSAESVKTLKRHPFPVQNIPKKAPKRSYSVPKGVRPYERSDGTTRITPKVGEVIGSMDSEQLRKTFYASGRSQGSSSDGSSSNVNPLAIQKQMAVQKHMSTTFTNGFNYNNSATKSQPSLPHCLETVYNKRKDPHTIFGSDDLAFDPRYKISKKPKSELVDFKKGSVSSPFPACVDTYDHYMERSRIERTEAQAAVVDQYTV